jgi:hypothetical protein
MNMSEIAHRTRERLRQNIDRFRARNAGHNVDLELDDLLIRTSGSLKSYFLEGPAGRFYASIQNRKRTREFFQERYPDWLARTLQDARALCEHRVQLLAHQDVDLGKDIGWHRDPISGFEWPQRYWADYDLLNAPADVKVIHELNRHQHLPRLAKAAFVADDEHAANEALQQIENWIEQNPKWRGVNWQSSLEIAVRSISWLWTIFLLLPSEALDENTLRRICRSLFAQLDHVYRYPSVYTSPNTHLIGEATALFIAGVLFPEIPRSVQWREFGQQTLIQSMEAQVMRDGVYGELSSYYHCYAADFYLLALILARRNDISFPESFSTRLSLMFDFVMHITRPDGTIPLIGDDDGGRALKIASEDYSSYCDGLSTAAVLFGRSELKYQAASFREESLWLLGPESHAVFDALHSSPAASSRAFADSGYFVQRSGWNADDTHVVFDCGGFGISSGGHGHADALSLTLFSGGREILIDPGTAAYNCAPEWRRFFRSATAHNTMIVDGAGESQPGETFRWKNKAPARLVNQVALPELDYVDGIVEGNFTHRRRLIYVRPNYWIVLDGASGPRRHDFEFLYHFAADTQLCVMSDEARAEIDCRAIIGETGLQLLSYATSTIQAEVICGQREPIQGWSSTRYGERHVSPVLSAAIRDVPAAAMISFLVPGNEPVRTQRFKSNTNAALAAAIEQGDYTDVVVMAGQDGDIQFMGYALRGELFWMRFAGANVCRLFAVNAHSFACGSETIFESEQVIPYVQAHFWENGVMIQRGESVAFRPTSFPLRRA